MAFFITLVHILACVLIVLVVLLQSGKGAEVSASLSGSSQTIFGSSGGANFFTKLTGGAAAVFMITSLALTKAGSQSTRSVMEKADQTPMNTAPIAAPVAPSTGGGAAAPAAQPAVPSESTPKPR